MQRVVNLIARAGIHYGQCKAWLQNSQIKTLRINAHLEARWHRESLARLNRHASSTRRVHQIKFMRHDMIYLVRGF